MENKKFVIGIDFGSDSVRALVVDAATGEELATSVSFYRRWKQGDYCVPKENQYRQHPQDYIDSLTFVVTDALSRCSEEVRQNVVGLSFDTTASTPAIVDTTGTPLALLPEFAEDPDAMFVLWKDHTSIAEADEINALAHSWEVDYTKYSGGTYSCEWAWSKVLHILRRNEAIRQKAYSWVEHCDWISGLLVGNIRPETIARSRCVAGHKVMWNEEWGGLPSRAFAERLDAKLADMRDTFSAETYTADHCVGGLTAEWAEILGLNEGIAVGVGAIDCHIGAVGAGISNNVQVKVYLMATYYDTDKIEYSKEIVELGSEIYHTSEDSYCRGRVVQLVARTYAAVGNRNKAFEWASKAHSILNAAEFLEIDIDTDIEMMWANYRFANYWLQMHLFYAAMKMGGLMNKEEAQSLYRSVAAVFDALTPLSRDDEDRQNKRHLLQTLIEE